MMRHHHPDLVAISMGLGGWVLKSFLVPKGARVTLEPKCHDCTHVSLNKCECNMLQHHERNIPQANDMFTPEPAKHYKHIHWTWGQHIHICSFFLSAHACNSSLTEVIDHCTIDFHWVRHRDSSSNRVRVGVHPHYSPQCTHCT